MNIINRLKKNKKKKKKKKKNFFLKILKIKKKIKIIY